MPNLHDQGKLCTLNEKYLYNFYLTLNQNPVTYKYMLLCPIKISFNW